MAGHLRGVLELGRTLERALQQRVDIQLALLELLQLEGQQAFELLGPVGILLGGLLVLWGHTQQPLEGLNGILALELLKTG
ncbi:hypothetical protein DYH09_35820 [bacterium CPR1]|nr:hypothetical protein [bacterium CPR1]